MATQAQNPEGVGNSGGPSLSEFKAMFAELLDGTKKDILAQVQESIEQVYADFEYVETNPEGGEEGSVMSPDAAVVTKIDEFIQPKTSDHAGGSSSVLSRSWQRNLVLRRKHPLPLMQTWRT